MYTSQHHFISILLWKGFSTVYEMYIQFKFFGEILLKNLENNFSLKDLAEKLVILLCLLSSQRDQTIKELNIKHMILEKVNCTFFIKQ